VCYISRGGEPYPVAPHNRDVRGGRRFRRGALTPTTSWMSPEQCASLRKLQDYERSVAIKTFKLQDELLGPIEEKIQQELFSRKVE
jgi:hypothetical protein